jgi:hypothetical protein
MDVILGLVRLFAFLLGLCLVAWAVFSAIQTFVLPRSAPDVITRAVFLFMRRVFDLRLKRARTYLERDRIMAFYAPFGLMALLPTWYAIVMLGYMGMYWGVGVLSWHEDFLLSGSSLLTLGFATVETPLQTVLVFSEAVIGLILVALLIAYLPTMYAAFSRRETAVTLLEVRAGNPPSAIEMLLRYSRIHGLDQLGDIWHTWENWFAEIEESHTSLPALVFFRSPQPEHSWVTAAGAVLDCAALTLAAVDIPPDASAALCLRAGYLALRRISDFFAYPYNPDPHFPATPITVTRAEFDAALDSLAANSIPLKADREQAWKDFGGWRVNYDEVLRYLAAFTLAPEAPWSSDRAATSHKPPLRNRRS